MSVNEVNEIKRDYQLVEKYLESHERIYTLYYLAGSLESRINLKRECGESEEVILELQKVLEILEKILDKKETL